MPFFYMFKTPLFSSCCPMLTLCGKDYCDRLWRTFIMLSGEWWLFGGGGGAGMGVSHSGYPHIAALYALYLFNFCQLMLPTWLWCRVNNALIIQFALSRRSLSFLESNLTQTKYAVSISSRKELVWLPEFCTKISLC